MHLATKCIASFTSHFPPAALPVTPDRSLRCFPLDADATLEVAMHPDLTAAAQLLLEIAGPASEHIEMSRTGPAKYYTVPRSVTLDDCLKHLRGVKTRGAQLRHPEHMARALAFDTDTNKIYPGWWWMRGAAQQLADAGYQVLLEPSPAGRGGHLWIIFDALVDARAAHRHVCELAPVLADVREYWPGPAHAVKWNKVRLPGGRYVTPEKSAWCKLYDANGSRLSDHGLAAARVLLASQTPASIVPPLPSDEQEMPPDAPAPHRERAERLLSQTNMTQPSAPASRKEDVPDLQQQKYGEATRFLWFRYSPAQVAAWYNERHTVDDLLDFNRHGMTNAEALGRPERTPSLGSTRDRQHWADFGAAAREDDGRPIGGDVLELLVRTSGQSKAQVLRALGREMVTEARAELERAAARQVDPPMWVQQIMSEAGWNHYLRLRNEYQRKPHESGLSGA
jgi:hypothetical protein